MQIKHIDNELKTKVRGVDLSKVLNLFVFIRIYFLESNESAPWSILKNIFKKSLSTMVNKTLIDFLKPNFLKFNDLTETDLSMFWNSS